jgi:hypothetical protein
MKKSDPFRQRTQTGVSEINGNEGRKPALGAVLVVGLL